MGKNVVVNKTGLFEYMAIFLLLYIMSSYHMAVVQALAGSVRIALLLFVAIILCFRNKLKSINLVPINVIFILLITALISLFLRGDSLYNYIILIFAVAIGYLFYVSIDFSIFVDIYVKILSFLATFSLATFFIAIVMPSIISKFPIINLNYEKPVHNLFFSVVVLGANMQRNYGLFWEPGAFQVFLNLALVFELFYLRQINVKRIIILIVSIVSTFSTTGYFALCLILVAYFFNIRNTIASLVTKHKSIIKITIFIIVISTLALLLVPTEYKDLVFGKLRGLQNNDAELAFTTKVRIDSINYPFKAFINSPLYGIGYDNFNTMNADYLNGFATSTILNWFALFGIMWGVPCTVMYSINIKRLNTTKISRFFLTLAFLLIISTESFLGNPFIYIFVFYGSEVMNIKKTPIKNKCKLSYDTFYRRKGM